MKVRCFVFLFLLFGVRVVYGQFPTTEGDPEYTAPELGAVTFLPQEAHKQDRQSAPPIIPLRGNLYLELSFDYLGDTPISPVYRIVHCTPEGRPSDLISSDYLTGFEENTFPAPESSQGTVQPYLHYTLRLPNNDISLKLGGNYAIEVRDGYNEQQVLLRREFALSEPLVRVTLEQREVAGAKRLTHQHLWAHLDVEKLGRLLDPRDLRVFVGQGWNNGRWQELPRHSWEGATGLLYGGQDTGRFAGGDHWHVLDLQSLRTPGQGVRSLLFREGAYHAEVIPDRFTFPGREREHATSRADLKGWCVEGYTLDRIRSTGGKYFPLEAEYTWVYFTLEGVPGQSVVLEIGGRTLPMHYSQERGAYEASLYLKQGVYSYRYVVDGQFAEGNSAETHNEYHHLVYYRPRGGRYWTLVRY